jgi:hypothetical protein
MRSCGTYIRKDEIFIHASAKNTFGIHQTCEPFSRIAQPVSPQELGEKILAALDAYREGVPGELYVRGVKRPPDPFLAFTKARSWKQFERGTNYFLITADDSEVEIIPSTPAAKGGFLHRPNDAARCPAQADKIGRALLDKTSQES